MDISMFEDFPLTITKVERRQCDVWEIPHMREFDPRKATTKDLVHSEQQESYEVECFTASGVSFDDVRQHVAKFGYELDRIQYGAPTMTLIIEKVASEANL